MSIALICLASVLTVFYIAAPFWRVRREKNAPRSATRDKSQVLARRNAALSALMARRDDLLREIKDLEFDRRMGKVDPEEYSAMRGELTAQAKAVLGQVETLRAQISAPQTKSPSKTKPVEKPVASQSSAPHWELEIESEILIARARRRLKDRSDEAARWRCDCGRTMKASDAFCASCGAPRPREAAAAAA